MSLFATIHSLEYRVWKEKVSSAIEQDKFLVIKLSTKRTFIILWVCTCTTPFTSMYMNIPVKFAPISALCVCVCECVRLSRTMSLNVCECMCVCVCVHVKPCCRLCIMVYIICSIYLSTSDVLLLPYRASRGSSYIWLASCGCYPTWLATPTYTCWRCIFVCCAILRYLGRSSWYKSTEVASTAFFPPTRWPRASGSSFS